MYEYNATNALTFDDCADDDECRLACLYARLPPIDDDDDDLLLGLMLLLLLLVSDCDDTDVDDADA